MKETWAALAGHCDASVLLSEEIAALERRHERLCADSAEPEGAAAGD